MGTPKSPMSLRIWGNTSTSLATAPLAHPSPPGLIPAPQPPGSPQPHGHTAIPTHPSREEATVLELAQEEGDEEGAGHEHK